MARLGAVLLAAGASHRFGAENKLLAEVGGEPLVRRVAQALVAAGLAEIVVVTGHDEGECRRVLDGLALRFAHNAAWADGMGSSIATGVAAIDAALDGVFIVPGDMPLLAPALVRRMAAAFDDAGMESIVYAATPRGEQRNPVLWPLRHLAELALLTGPEGAKVILNRESSRAKGIPVDDTAALADVDTPAELAAARARLAGPH